MGLKTTGDFMKLITLLTMLLLISCKEGQNIIDIPKNLGREILRIDDKTDEDQQTRLTDLENRMNVAEKKYQLQQKLIDLLSSNIDGNSDAIEVVEDIINSMLDRLDIIEDQELQDIQDEIDLLNDALGFQITELIDPCGDDVNEFDEILLVLGDGSIVAYMEDGGTRFLSTLQDGNYRTTDEQECNFSVVNGTYQE